MALVVFLRGVNVGGHRTFRPSLLAKQLSDHDVVNIGAAGTFVVRKPGPRSEFEAELRRRLPFECSIALCHAREILALESADPFKRAPAGADITRFVSVLPRAGRMPVALPVSFPSTGKWLVRIMGAKGQFVFGVYRRHMKTIGYLGQVDKLFDGRATTRNWNTIRSVVAVLKSE